MVYLDNTTDTQKIYIPRKAIEPVYRGKYDPPVLQPLEIDINKVKVVDNLLMYDTVVSPTTNTDGYDTITVTMQVPMETEKFTENGIFTFDKVIGTVEIDIETEEYLEATIARQNAEISDLKREINELERELSNCMNGNCTDFITCEDEIERLQNEIQWWIDKYTELENAYAEREQELLNSMGIDYGKTVTYRQNGTYRIEPNDGYGGIEYAEIYVNVPNGEGDTKIKNANITAKITENGEYEFTFNPETSTGLGTVYLTVNVVEDNKE